MRRGHRDGWALVVGPGAIGSLIADSLERSGVRTARVGRGARARREPGCRAAFLCVKASSLRAAIAAARPAVGPDTAVVGLMNGLGHERVLRAAFGRRRTVLGSCYVAALREDGVARHMGGRLIQLAADPSGAAALREARGLLRAAGWDARVARSPERMLWTKAVFNAAINPLGALLGARNGELARDPALRAILSELAVESVRAARAAGHPPLYAGMASKVAAGCLAAPDQVSSMAQDLAAGRPSEAPAILAPLVAAARRRAVPVPTLTAVSRLLGRLEEGLLSHAG